MDKVQKIRKEVEKLKSQLLIGACSSQIAMETRCKEEAYNEVLAILDTVQEEHVSRTPADIEAAMQEVEEKSRAFTEAHHGEDADTILAQMRGEEPVSEGLEEASKEWLRPQLDKSYANYGEVKMMELTHFDGYAMLDAIEFGAKWQKTKDESTTEDLEEYINELSKQFPEVSFAKLSRIAVRVANWQKQKDNNNANHALVEQIKTQQMCYKKGVSDMKQQMMAKAIDGYVIKDIEEGNGDFLLSADYLPKSMGLKDQQRVKVIVIKNN